MTALSLFCSTLALVDPFIGTSGDGHVTPAATVPFGLVQAGPDTGIGKWAYTSGYQYDDQKIVGFSQTHLSGTGCPDLGDVSIMPFTGEYDGYGWSNFKKDTEHAEPGRYRVLLKKGGIGVDITTTARVGLYSFAYPTGQTARVCLNLPFAIDYPGGWSCKWHASEVSVRGEDTVTGWYDREVWSRRKVAFAVRFSRPFTNVRKLVAAEGNRPPKLLLDFDLPADEPLLVKVALSRNTPDAALANMAAETNGWDFAARRAAAAAAWDGYLSRVTAEGEANRLRLFYTSLYRLAVQPNDVSDVGEQSFYSTFSCWDTFRAAHPLYTLLTPERVPGMVDSMLAQGRTTGYLPVWALWGHENQCMIGTHSIPVIADAFLKGLWPNPTIQQTDNPTLLQAYRQIKETLTKTHADRIKEDWPLLDRYGYYPFDVIAGESVSRTLECSYDDWCAGKMAERLGKDEDARFFFRRAAGWTNVIDRILGVARGRDSSGRWREPFDPGAYGHGAGSGNDFTEGNAWQYTWHVLQDAEGLMSALGGKEKFVERLDAFFNAPDDSAATKTQKNVNGFIGRYAHGNEPCHHVIYLYSLAGRPDRTAELVREVCDRYYRACPEGLFCNDDCGQMSAWYVFACLGFYPVNPCGGEYVLGAPQLEKVTLEVRGGGGERKTFTVLAKGLSKENKYVKSVTLNGRPLTRPILRQADILAGGTLVFEMTSRPAVDIDRLCPPRPETAARYEASACPEAVRPYREAALSVYRYMTALPAMTVLVETGKPNQKYQHNAYVSKTHAAHVEAMLAWARAEPARRAVALRFAKASAEFLLGELEPTYAPLAWWPPTYGRTPLEYDPTTDGPYQKPCMFGNEPEGAVKYRGEVMLIYPADVGRAFLDYYGETRDRRFLTAAVGIGETYLRTRRPDGSWPLKMRLASGEAIGENTLVPDRLTLFFRALHGATGDERWRQAEDASFAWLEAHPLTDWNWDGQFEDIRPEKPYRNPTKHNAIETMMYLLQRFPGDKDRLATCRKILEFCEKRFVVWKAPASHPNWPAPSVLEQYSCFTPIDASASKMIRGYLAMYRADGRAEDLAKARALGNMLTRVQKPSGRIPTFWTGIKTGDSGLSDERYDWLNCMASSARALLELEACAAKIGAAFW